MKKWLVYILFNALMFGSVIALAQDFKLEATLTGNVGEIQNIRFSPDGRLLAGGEQFGNVLIWNTKTKSIERTLKFHNNKRVLEVTFNKGGSLLASTCEDGSVAVWDTKTWRMIAAFKNKPFVSFDGRELVSSSFVVFSPDSKYIYFGGDNGYVMKGQITPDATGGIKPAESIFSANYEDGRWYGTITGGCLSADEKYLVISVGHLVNFIDLKTEILAKYYRYDEGYLNDVVVGPLANSVATWSDDGKVNIWNNAGAIAASFQVTTPGNYSGASFSRDSKYLVSSASGTIAKLWDMTNGRQIGTLSSHSRIVRISRFSPAENMVATASYDGTVKLWKDKTEPPLEEILASKGEPKKEEPVKVEPVKVEPPIKVEETRPVVVTETPKKDILKEAKIEEIKEGDVIQLEHILFRQSQAILLASSYDEVKQLIDFMKKYPTVVIELSGHTDNVGIAARNQTLSEQRVNVIKNRLVMNGIDESRIETVAYGGSRPIADNGTEAGRQKNRRVEMKILKK